MSSSSSSSTPSTSSTVAPGSAGAGSGAPVFNTGGSPLWAWLQENRTPVPLAQAVNQREYLLLRQGKRPTKVTIRQDATNGLGYVWLYSEGLPQSNTHHVNRVVNQTETDIKLYEIPVGATTGFVGGKGKQKKRKTRAHGKKRKAKKTRKQ